MTAAPRAPRLRAAGGVIAALAAGLALSGCAPTVAMQPSAGATLTACASVVVGLPPTIGSLKKRETDAQGTGAWGDPVAVSLWCGVAQPGPTTDQCIPVDGVDWIVHDLGGQRYLVTTYGRSPAVQVEIDTSRIGSSVALPPISDAVAAAGHATAHCTTGTETPTPSPTP